MAMKTRVLTFAAALAIVVLATDTSDAARLIYRRSLPLHVHLARPVVVAPVYPVVTPSTTTIVGPNVVVGPLGRIHYVAPVRPFGTHFYVR
jgi:hypothetical protein